jgi:hypothetical protein
MIKKAKILSIICLGEELERKIIMSDLRVLVEEQG